MAAARQTVRVFISSTFRDMHAERDHLVTVVFPELRERIERLGLEFFDVDLRWGVPAKDANGETANSWEYCRQWIDRVEPFFVCILGQRYGWEPEPEQLKAKDDSERQRVQRRSITDMEVHYAVLNSTLKPRSYFYLRATEAPATAGEYVDPPPLLGKLAQLKKEVRSCGRPVRDYLCQWTVGGFTGMEEFGRRVLEDLWSGVLRDERYVGKDVWRQALGGDPDSDRRYTDESKPVPEDIAAKIVALAKPEPKDPLDAEREQMERFAQLRRRWFQGRTNELRQLTDFLQAAAPDAPRLAVMAAVPGQGKSALLAYLHEQLKSSPDFVITHFVGATERSASSHALVERLLGELDRSGITWPAEQQGEGQEPKRDYNSLCLRLAQRLGDYAGDRRIVILLDAINQLSDGNDLHWLPNRLGPGVRVIVSCIEDAAAKSDSPEQRVLHALDMRQPPPLPVRLKPLEAEDVRAIVVAYLEEYCHVLDREHLDTLCAVEQARNPLYLLVMLNELRTLGGNDLNRVVPVLIASMPQDHPDTVSLFRWVLQRLEVFDENVPDAARWWCLYLAHGRVGMSSHELADLLARRLGAGASATALRIERGLRRYLQRRGGQLDFFHGQLRQAVFEQYGPEGDSANVHSDTATYFRDLADPEKNQSWKGDSPRPFLQVVFHLAGAQRLDELCQTLCDLHFVEARCRAGQIFDLIADYRLAQESLPESQADLRKERVRDERVRRWTGEIIEYSRQWSNRRDRLERRESVAEPEPMLPEPVPTCEMRSEERIQAECERIIRTPTRRDRLVDFAGFVDGQCYPLLEHGQRPGFVLQHAFNAEPDGPVHGSARQIICSCGAPVLLRRWPANAAYNPMPALLQTLHGHQARVTCVSVSADGRCAVSGSDCVERELRVWNLETGECLHILTGHADEITSVSMTPDGRLAVSSSKDKTIRVWDLIDGSCLSVLEGHTESVNGVSVTPDGRLAVSAGGSWTGKDPTVRVWNLLTGECVSTLRPRGRKVHNPWVNCVCVTADGRRALAGNYDKLLRWWDIESGECLGELVGHDEIIGSVAVTPDGRRAVSSDWGKTIRVWDLERAECLRMFDQDLRSVDSVSISPDGRCVISSEQGTICVRDVEHGECLRILQEPSTKGGKVCASADGRLAVSADDSNALRVWDLASGRCPDSPTGAGNRIIDIATDGRHVVTATDNLRVQVWDFTSGKCVRSPLNGFDSPDPAVSVTPDARRAVTVNYFGTIGVWDLATGKPVHALKSFRGDGSKIVSIAPDGRLAVVADSECKTLQVWDLNSGTRMRILKGHCKGMKKTEIVGITSVRVTPDGCHAVSAGWDGLIMVWDLNSGKCLHALNGHASGATVATNGIRAVSVGYDDSLRVWNLDDGACLHVLDNRAGPSSSLGVSVDGKRAVSANDQTVRLWDLDRGLCLAEFATTVPVSACAVDSDHVVIGTVSGSVIFADLRNYCLSQKECNDLPVER